jgi:hypothetical protein
MGQGPRAKTAVIREGGGEIFGLFFANAAWLARLGAFLRLKRSDEPDQKVSGSNAQGFELVHGFGGKQP